MKKLGIILLLAILIACKENKTESEVQTTGKVENTTNENKAYDSYGERITTDNVLDAIMMQEKFVNMHVGDTLDVKFTAKVVSVCKEKGCWMKLVFPAEMQSMVKFKDYAFFVPKDIEGKTVIVKGKAYVNEMSVDEQQHYAKDAGKSDEEILAITNPKKTFSVMADGVLIKKQA